MFWLKNIKSSPKGFFKNLWIFFAVVGPGIITANVDNDAGGIATYSVAGSHFGLPIMWTIVPIAIMLTIIMEMSSRLGVITGRGLSDLIREQFGLKVTFYLMIALIVTNIGNVIANFAGVAAGVGIFGISKYASVPLAAFFVWTLIVKWTYKPVEKVFMTACLFYLAYVISGFLIKPDWALVAKDSLEPSFSMQPEYLYIVMGLVGTSIAPWMQFYQQSAVVEKGIKPENLKHARWDVIAGTVTVVTVIFFIIMTCALTLYKAGIRIETAQDAALALRPISGQYCFALFAFGLVNASLFASSIIPLSTSFSVCEGLGWESGVNKTFKEAPHFYGLYTAIIIISAAVVLIPDFPLMKVMILSQVINGFLLPFVMIFMLILINKKDLMGEYKNGKAFNILSWTTAAVLIALSIALIVTAL